MKHYLALFAAICFAVSPGMAAPPDGADSKLTPWFEGLRQPGTGKSCCSIADCRPVDYRTSGDHYEALIRGNWVAIPADKVLQRVDNPTGNAVVCWTPTLGVMCFVRAAET
jgi:hypothetical protein